MLGIEYILFTTGISKKEVAFILDLSPSAVSHFITGKRKIRWRQSELLSSLTGVPSEYFSKELTRQDKIEIELVLGARANDDISKVMEEMATLRAENRQLRSRLKASEATVQRMKGDIISFVEGLD